MASICSPCLTTKPHKSQPSIQHIDFLKEESFFQKAHRAAKQENLITRHRRTREFYHDYAAEHGVNYRSLQMHRTGGTRTGNIKLGRMYFFRYAAEGTASGRGVDIKRGNVYDAFPLVSTPSGFIEIPTS